MRAVAELARDLNTSLTPESRLSCAWIGPVHLRMRPTMQTMFYSVMAASDGRLAFNSLIAACAVAMAIRLLVR